MENLIRERLEASLDVKRKMAKDMTLITKCTGVVALLVKALTTGQKLLVAGNGGSAADAQHMAGEFVGKFLKERRGMPAIALTTNSSVVTAWANDVSYDDIFARQIEALGKPGDVFIGISTSGNSPTITQAFEKAKKEGLRTVALLGKSGGKAKGMADYELIVPSNSTPRIQEAQVTLMHIICELVEATCEKHFQKGNVSRISRTARLTRG